MKCVLACVRVCMCMFLCVCKSLEMRQCRMKQKHFISLILLYPMFSNDVLIPTSHPYAEYLCNFKFCNLTMKIISLSFIFMKDVLNENK